MKLPNMKYGSGITKHKQITFGGLNHSLSAGDGELWEMKNLTSDHFPALASRPIRYKKWEPNAEGENFQGGILWRDGLYRVKDRRFYDGDEAKGELLLEPGIKTLAAMGPYIVILPDKCCYNTETGVFKEMESVWSGASLTFGNGKLYGEDADANTITCDGVDWGRYFRAGDAVTITGCTVTPSNNLSLIIREIDGDKLHFYEHSFTLGESQEAYTEEGNLSIERRIPDLKYVCENGNRLWGCDDATIYASKLGDIFNWNVFDGLGTDSYALKVGSEGRFTGCISYLGYPMFFKEDHICKVYGSLPSNFEVIESDAPGVMAGCDRSLAIAGGTLFYLSRSGVMAYSQGFPRLAGEELGAIRYSEAVAGSDGIKYYISMNDGSDWFMFVYDTRKGLWHKEDKVHATHFTKCEGILFYLNAEGEIWAIGKNENMAGAMEPEGNVEWEAEFADFTEYDPNKKGVGKIQIRLELDAGAEARVYMMFDSDGAWRQVGSAMSEGVKRSYYLPIVPRRADHYRLKLEGTGGCRIHSMVYEYYRGSELRSKAGRN